MQARSGHAESLLEVRIDQVSFIDELPGEWREPGFWLYYSIEFFIVPRALQHRRCQRGASRLGVSELSLPANQRHARNIRPHRQRE